MRKLPPIKTGRFLFYLALLGLVILSSVLVELPQLRLPVLTGDDERPAEVTSATTTTSTRMKTTPNTTTTTAWCILDRKNTVRYFKHFPHALQSLAPCWSYFCRMRQQLREEVIRCGIYIQQPIRFPWESVSLWTRELVEAMGCDVVVQQEDVPVGSVIVDSNFQYRVPDRDVSRYAFFEKKEHVQELQAQVMGSAADGDTDANGHPKKREIRIGLLQRIRKRPKQPSRMFLNLPDIASKLRTAFPNATVDETDMRGFSLKEQASWWHQNDVVVAAHGAAITNSIFLLNTKKEAATVIEIYPDGFHPYIFGALMKTLGVHRLTIDRNASITVGKDSDLRPDPELVVQLVQKALRVSSPVTLNRPDAVTVVGRTSSAPPSPRSSPPRDVVAYTRMRTDRFGSSLHDILHAHAYCFAHNMTYGGSCALDERSRRRSHESQSLVDFLGLTRELKLACPHTGSLSHHNMNETDDSGNNFVVLDVKRYNHDELFTPEWISYMNDRRNIAEAAATTTTIRGDDDGREAPLQVAVYVRRGDVDPCAKGSSHWRYLPNSYYLRVLDHYLPPDRPATVKIYSQPRSPAENFADFSRRNYTVMLEAPINQVWEAIMTADIAVLSKSSFSYVPAIFNTRGTVLYTNFWHQPLSSWVQVNQTIQKQGAADLRSLQKVYCTK